MEYDGRLKIQEKDLIAFRKKNDTSAPVHFTYIDATIVNQDTDEVLGFRAYATSDGFDLYRSVLDYYNADNIVDRKMPIVLNRDFEVALATKKNSEGKLKAINENERDWVAVEDLDLWCGSCKEEHTRLYQYQFGEEDWQTRCNCDDMRIPPPTYFLYHKTAGLDGRSLDLLRLPRQQNRC